MPRTGARASGARCRDVIVSAAQRRNCGWLCASLESILEHTHAIDRGAARHGAVVGALLAGSSSRAASVEPIAVGSSGPRWTSRQLRHALRRPRRDLAIRRGQRVRAAYTRADRRGHGEHRVGAERPQPRGRPCHVAFRRSSPSASGLLKSRCDSAQSSHERRRPVQRLFIDPESTNMDNIGPIFTGPK